LITIGQQLKTESTQKRFSNYMKLLSAIAIFVAHVHFRLKHINFQMNVY